jgi:hypothetical protein
MVPVCRGRVVWLLTTSPVEPLQREFSLPFQLVHRLGQAVRTTLLLSDVPSLVVSLASVQCTVLRKYAQSGIYQQL